MYLLLLSVSVAAVHHRVPVSVGLLHSAGGWRAFPGSFGGQLLPRRLSSGGFTSGLLGTSHSSPAGLKTNETNNELIIIQVLSML